MPFKRSYLKFRGMRLACYVLPRVPRPIIGVEYFYEDKKKPNNDGVLFWQPPFKHYPAVVWEWVPKTSSWSKVLIPLPPDLVKDFESHWKDNFEDNQEKRGLWLIQMSKLDKKHALFSEATNETKPANLTSKKKLTYIKK